MSVEVYPVKREKDVRADERARVLRELRAGLAELELHDDLPGLARHRLHGLLARRQEARRRLPPCPRRGGWWRACGLCQSDPCVCTTDEDVKRNTHTAGAPSVRALGTTCFVCGGRGRRSSWVNELGHEVEAACPDCDGTGTLTPAAPSTGDGERGRTLAFERLWGALTFYADEANYDGPTGTRALVTGDVRTAIERDRGHVAREAIDEAAATPSMWSGTEKHGPPAGESADEDMRLREGLGAAYSLLVDGDAAGAQQVLEVVMAGGDVPGESAEPGEEAQDA